MNAVLPNFNVGRILTNGGPTGGSVETLLNGMSNPWVEEFSETGSRTVWRSDRFGARPRPEIFANSITSGSVPPFPPQYHIDVIDCARIHLVAAALDNTVENERIFAFARPFSFTEMIKDLKELRPKVEKTVAQPPKEEGNDLSKVPNELGAELLKKWYDQKSYKTMRQSIEEALASLKI